MTVRWSTQYRDKSGFTCALEVEGEDGNATLDQAAKVEAYLLGKGAQPVDPFSAPSAAQIAANLAADRAAQLAPSPAPGGQQQDHGEGWCSLHNCQMQKRSGSDGGSWYSHKDPAGKWCRGG